jgi:hypothetical protein
MVVFCQIQTVPVFEDRREHRTSGAEQNSNHRTQRQDSPTGFFIKKNPTSRTPAQGYLFEFCSKSAPIMVEAPRFRNPEQNQG